MDDKRFFQWFAAGVVASAASAATLNALDIDYASNEVVRHHQTNKLKRVNECRVLIVGDSSSGNAILASEFERLSGLPTLNLSMTGSFGFLGNAALVEHAERDMPTVSTVIIAQHPRNWARTMLVQGYFDLGGSPFSPVLRAADPSAVPGMDYAQYWTNPDEFYAAFQYVSGAYPHYTIDPELDYLKQAPATYANGELQLKDDARIADTIVEQEVRLFGYLDDLCGQAHFRCVFVHGPVHQGEWERSRAALEGINRVVARAEHIDAIQEVLTFPNEQMGDSTGHVAEEYKRESTRRYFELLAPHLR